MVHCRCDYCAMMTSTSSFANSVRLFPPPFIDYLLHFCVKLRADSSDSDVRTRRCLTSDVFSEAQWLGPRLVWCRDLLTFHALNAHRNDHCSDEMGITALGAVTNRRTTNGVTQHVQVSLSILDSSTSKQCHGATSLPLLLPLSLVALSETLLQQPPYSLLSFILIPSYCCNHRQSECQRGCLGRL